MLSYCWKSHVHPVTSAVVNDVPSTDLEPSILVGFAGPPVRQSRAVTCAILVARLHGSILRVRDANGRLWSALPAALPGAFCRTPSSRSSRCQGECASLQWARVSHEADEHEQDSAQSGCVGLVVQAMDDVNGFSRGGSPRIQGLGPRHEEEKEQRGHWQWPHGARRSTAPRWPLHCIGVEFLVQVESASENNMFGVIGGAKRWE